jgi:hypothetical protein
MKTNAPDKTTPTITRTIVPASIKTPSVWLLKNCEPAARREPAVLDSRI